MEEDILKTWARDDSSMDMMAMMMQTEKFPELCQPFYNNTLTYAENEVSCGSCSSTTTLLPVFSNVNPNVTPPTPTPTWINPPLFNNPLQQPMTPSLQLQPNNEVVPSGSLRINPYPSAEKKSSVVAMREMIFRIAVMQPIHIEPESVKPPKRRNVKISKDPQSVAARHRRERISERIRILQRLVPGGTKMDTASMLDEAIHYVKFLKKQVQTLEQAAGATRPLNAVVGFPGGVSNASVNYSALVRGCQPCQMLASPSKQMLS